AAGRRGVRGGAALGALAEGVGARSLPAALGARGGACGLRPGRGAPGCGGARLAGAAPAMRRLVDVALAWLVAFAAVAADSRAAAAAVPPRRIAPDTARDSLKAFRAQNEAPDSVPEPVLVELQVGRA